jgi:hypothetical protein
MQPATRAADGTNRDEYRELERRQLALAVGDAEKALSVAQRDAAAALLMADATARRAVALSDAADAARAHAEEAQPAVATCNAVVSAAADHCKRQREFLEVCIEKQGAGEAARAMAVPEAETTATAGAGVLPTAAAPVATNIPTCSCDMSAWLGRVVPRPPRYTAPPRSIYAVGNTVQRYVTLISEDAVRAGGLPWIAVAAPDDASIVWERDKLADFRRQSYNGHRQQLVRLGPSVEQALGNKASLARLLTAARSAFVPESYVFQKPQDFLAFLPAAGRLRGNWILKRGDLASGFGLRVVTDAPRWFDAEKVALMNMVRDGKPFVLQRYVEPPMLVDGHKFDCRTYVFILNVVAPTVAFVADGYARLCTKPYAHSAYDDPAVHIANIAQNRTTAAYSESEAAPSAAPSAADHRPPTFFLRTLPDALGDAYDAVRSRMDDAMRDIVAAAASAASPPGSVGVPADVLWPGQLFGVDFTVDAAGHPWVTEVQVCPALGVEATSRLLVAEVLELQYDKLRRRMNGDESLSEWRAPRRLLRRLV